ncbi:LysE family translocator [Caballeronia sp. BR00000012568055]|uniref:LysE family translocator n=1 Tax=Caballeronia sp. BR00000012568055 TaxID=2918761 RepID=UPI0023F9AD25|nr:LysE family translocator [Caballeronia sp. BR00000012568055]
MATAEWFAFSVATLAATSSPGPNAMLVVRNTVRYGIGSAIFTVIGNLCARCVTASGVMLGLNVLLGASPWLLLSLRLGGAAFLIWLGVKAVRARRPLASPARGNERACYPRLKVGVEASIVSMSNPNTLGFFAAALPQLVDLNAPLLPQWATLIVIDTGVVLGVMATYALVTHAVHRRVANPARLTLIRRGGGIALIVVGITMLPLR